MVGAKIQTGGIENISTLFFMDIRNIQNMGKRKKIIAIAKIT